MALIRFGEYLPDQADLENPGAPKLSNVVPGPSGYRPMPATVLASAALTARCQGAFSFIDKAANVYTYAGDATKIYRVLPQGLTQVHSGATIAATDIWDAVQWKETAIFTDYADAVQTISLGGTSFAALFTSTLKPKAKCITQINTHIVLGFTSDATDGVVPYRVWWSADGNPADMQPAAATLADNQDLEAAGGDIKRIIGGFEYGLVFQERQISRMTKTGGADIFQFYPLIKTRGLFAAGAIAAIDRLVFFLAEDGFYACDGTSVRPIGANKVDKTFFNALDASNVSRISFAIDPINKNLWVAYPSTSASNGHPDSFLVYNWTLDRWASGSQTVEMIFAAYASGYTLETLDNVSSSIDALSDSLDSRFWTGGKATLSGFNILNRMVTFTGAPLAAQIETGDFNAGEPVYGTLQRRLVTSVRPIVDGGTISMSLGYRNRPNDTITYSPSSVQNADGICPFAIEARYHRARVEIAAGGTWSHAIGIDAVEAVSTGQF